MSMFTWKRLHSEFREEMFFTRVGILIGKVYLATIAVNIYTWRWECNSEDDKLAYGVARDKEEAISLTEYHLNRFRQNAL